MAKVPKARLAEQRYIKRTRELLAKRKKKTRGRTPWKSFFASGAGTEIETTLAKASILAIVRRYGKKLDKTFTCSYKERGAVTLVKIEAVGVKTDEEGV